MSNDGADRQLRLQREETIARNREARLAQLRQGEQERARLVAHYAANRETRTDVRG